MCLRKKNKHKYITERNVAGVCGHVNESNPFIRKIVTFCHRQCKINIKRKLSFSLQRSSFSSSFV